SGGAAGNRGGGGTCLRNRACQSGTTPCGVTRTWTMRATPTINGNHSAESGVWVKSSGPKTRKQPPTAPAATDLTPTTIAIATTVSDCWKLNAPTLTEPMSGAIKPPANPAKPAETPNAASFQAVRLTPLVAAAISELRIARSTRPVFERLRFQTASAAAQK